MSMKKFYSQPYISIVELDPRDLIATSPVIEDDPVDPLLPNLSPERILGLDENPFLF